MKISQTLIVFLTCLFLALIPGSYAASIYNSVVHRHEMQGTPWKLQSGYGDQAFTLNNPAVFERPLKTEVGRFSNHSGQVIADQFVLSKDETINTVIWYGHYESDDLDPPLTFVNFDIHFFQDNSGLPGVELYNQTFSASVKDSGNRVISTDPFLNGRIIYQFQVDLNPPFSVLKDKVMWIEIAEHDFIASVKQWLWSRSKELPRFLTLPLQKQAVVGNGWQYGVPSDLERDDRHFAIDYFVDDNTIVTAAAEGYAMYDCQSKLSDSCDNPGSEYGYGRMVIIRHDVKDGSGNYFFTLYAHLSESNSKIPPGDRHKADNEIDVSKWFKVRRGQIIGKTGRSGRQSWPHLHFAVFTNDYDNACHPGPNNNDCEIKYTFDPYDLYKVTTDENSSNYYPPKKTETIPSSDKTRTRSSGSKYTKSGSHRLWVLDPPLPPSCYQYDSSTGMPYEGFGVPYNVLFDEKELLIQTLCGYSDVTVEVGSGKSVQFIWRQGYILNRDAWAWEPYDLTGDDLRYDNWYVGNANATISVPPEELQDIDNFILAYICTWIKEETKWKCGCRDENCEESYWQLQKFGLESEAKSDTAVDLRILALEDIPPPPPPLLFFVDVPLNYWAEEFIYKIYEAGITSGCSQEPLMYCPEDPVTRAEMAVFLERGINGSDYDPPGATGIFDDCPVGYWAADWVEQFYNDGITSGCSTNPLMYCPDDLVTRAEMAVFLLRSMYGNGYTPPSAAGIFDDVPVTHWASDWIEQLYDEGITGGCSTDPPLYCPDDVVTRAEMAVFIVRAFDL